MLRRKFSNKRNFGNKKHSSLKGVLDNYYGVDGLYFRSHGMSDAEVIDEDGFSYNESAIVDSLWSEYNEYCEENDIEPTDDERFVEFVQSNIENTISDLQFGVVVGLTEKDVLKLLNKEMDMEYNLSTQNGQIYCGEIPAIKLDKKADNVLDSFLNAKSKGYIEFEDEDGEYFECDSDDLLECIIEILKTKIFYI